MTKKQRHPFWIYIAIPAIMLLYYNQSANWHYHITADGIIVEHAHPFTNNMIPDTPAQDHEHSDLEYLLLAQLTQALGLIVLMLLLIGTIWFRKNKTTPLPLPIFPGRDHAGSNPSRAPPFMLY